MPTQTTEMKSKKGAVIITLIVVAILAAGIFWYMQSQNGSNDAGYNTEDLANNLKGIEAQDKAYKNVTSLQLLPLKDAEQQYQVVRPLEQVKAEPQTDSTTLTAEQAYALAKNGADGKAQYNASFFTYKLAGDMAEKSTDHIVKSQLDAAIAQAKQTEQPAGVTVQVGEASKSKDITIKTTAGERLTLASSQFSQTLSNGQDQKKLLSVVAAAKCGNHLLFINATFANEAQFNEAPELLQAMTDKVTLQLSQ